ncbi:MAG: element excision factor XisH family protein, partial [Nodosilinea sp.]
MKSKVSLALQKLLEFYGALGQFIAYRTALHRQDPERVLYLAAPESLFDKLFATAFVQELVRENTIYLITYSIDEERIVQWIPIP